MSGIPNLPGRPKPAKPIKPQTKPATPPKAKAAPSIKPAVSEPRPLESPAPAPQPVVSDVTVEATPAPLPVPPASESDSPAAEELERNFAASPFASPASPRVVSSTSSSSSGASKPKTFVGGALGVVKAIPTPVKLLVVCLAPLVSLGVIMMLPTQGTPEITSGDLDAARARWEADGPPSYALSLSFGRRTGYSNDVDMTLRVREGVAVAMTKNGRTINEASERENWTIDALFHQIEQEMAQRDYENANPEPGVAPVFVRGEFDETLGFPRLVTREQRGKPNNYSIEITGFRVLED